MAKKKRRAFPVQENRSGRRDLNPSHEVINADDPGFGIFGYFRNPGVRETIESIVIAVLLAFMFKTYEAEAFVIPTGSMAPSLQGQHLDLDCPQCGYRYLVGASQESDKLRKTLCPICNFETKLNPRNDADHRPNSGDRILVNKFIYDFSEPERFDVIVFKYPNNAKQNYIKRLIGLPGDNILVENGDIYLMTGSDETGWTSEIARKPSKKLKQVLIDVDDTKHIPGQLKTMGWPSRWAQWSGGSAWSRNANESMFVVSPSEDVQWLRYRNLAPRHSRLENKSANRKSPLLKKSDWKYINDGDLPRDFDVPKEDLPAGSLISDSMSYNNAIYLDQRISGVGQHWVGDIGAEIWIDVESPTGELCLDIVEGGVHFTCRLDVATGNATLQHDDSRVEFFNDSGTVETPKADTSLSSGSNQILFVNADDQLHLWVNGSLVQFDASKYRRTGIPIPEYSKEDPGDAEPVGVGGKNLSATVSRLKIVRDIYYSSVGGDNAKIGESHSNESGMNPFLIHQIMRDPSSWDSEEALRFFNAKKGQSQPMFRLKRGTGDDRSKDQFFPMGDNSTQSLDARIWGEDHFVERDLLIGRAIYVYWPHTLNEPVPFFPNFGKMKFIR